LNRGNRKKNRKIRPRKIQKPPLYLAAPVETVGGATREVREKEESCKKKPLRNARQKRAKDPAPWRRESKKRKTTVTEGKDEPRRTASTFQKKLYVLPPKRGKGLTEKEGGKAADSLISRLHKKKNKGRGKREG